MQAIIFDVDGVVFYGADENGQYPWRKTIESDLGITKEHIFHIYHTPAWQEVITGKLNTKDHLQTVFEAFPELSLTPEAYLSYWHAHDHHVNPEILALLQEITIPLYLGTNQDPYRSSHIQNHVGQHFKGMFSSSTLGFAKPDPGFYTQIEDALRMEPEHLLLIDDTFQNIEAAQTRGWKTFFYQDNLKDLQSFLCKGGVLNDQP